MTARDVIAESDELPAPERAIVAGFVVEHEDSWIPDEFKQGMADIAEGSVLAMDSATTNGGPPHAA